MEKYPKEVFVQICEDMRDDEEYLLAWKDAGNAEDGNIAVYELKKIAKKETNTVITNLK
ncbi:hypothetical protein LCGC14_1280640 [marine sediment metagenome]|uniref:Uncharacterized protein n=1 Tax=marine sediment metagenome TaxID=412755 RepID=A0A0F9NYG0_9ZZZZ